MGFELPKEISGRKYNGKGIHWGVQWHHGDWLNDWGTWTCLAERMGLRNAVILSANDSAVRPWVQAGNRSAVQVLLDSGIAPIIRWGPTGLPRPFNMMAHVRTYIQQVAPYDIVAWMLCGNEFGDEDEWIDKDMPPDAMEIGLSWWMNAARICIRIGQEEGYPVAVGFPDGPGYDWNPFEKIREMCLNEQYGLVPDYWDEFVGWWEDGKVFFAGHFYGLTRPHSYPYDHVTKYGVPITEEEYRKVLGAFWPEWKTGSVEEINAQRREWANPDLTPLDDDTCWRAWEKVAWWMRQTFGKNMPMCMTEGGWTPGSSTGTIPGQIDIRWPKPIPEQVARHTLKAFEAETTMFCQCPWTLAAVAMNGDPQWEGDAWNTGTYLNKGYGHLMPVVERLIRLECTGY